MGWGGVAAAAGPVPDANSEPDVSAFFEPSYYCALVSFAVSRGCCSISYKKQRALRFEVHTLVEGKVQKSAHSSAPIRTDCCFAGGTGRISMPWLSSVCMIVHGVLCVCSFSG